MDLNYQDIFQWDSSLSKYYDTCRRWPRSVQGALFNYWKSLQDGNRKHLPRKSSCRLHLPPPPHTHTEFAELAKWFGDFKAGHSISSASGWKNKLRQSTPSVAYSLLKFFEIDLLSQSPFYTGFTLLAPLPPLVTSPFKCGLYGNSSCFRHFPS